MTTPHASRRTFLKAAGTSALAAGMPLPGGLLDDLRAAFAAIFLAPPPMDDDMWPFLIEFDGSIITVYQPQPDKLDGDVLSGRAAISVQKVGADTPVFGSFTFRATLEIDNEDRTFLVREVKVLDLTLPATDDATKELAKEMLSEGLSGFDGTFDLDPLIASLEAESAMAKGSQDLGTKPPKILTADAPSMLVTIDGDPILEPAKEGSKVQRVANTPFTILQDPESKEFYLKGDDWWYVADAPTGPWTETEGVPDEVMAVVPRLPEDLEEEAREAKATSLEGDQPPKGKPPRPAVVVATEPSELIWTDGAVEWKTVPNTKLKYASNSSGYVVKGTDGRIYTVLSGRWYTGPSLDGPWTYVPSDKLPAEFAKIPPDSDLAGVLPFVAGTDEARAAVAAQQVPTTAEVKKSATTRVNWAGDPQFNDITGTSMRASENAGTPVIKVGNEYYACQNAVWYVANGPNETYRVATTVPPDIYRIPPQHPFYFTTFVRVFGQGEDVVYTGYYPGYKGSYQLGETVVNGTGYTPPPTVVNNTYIVQPMPPTWGFGMTYNPWMGWSMGMSMGFGVGAGWFVFSVGRRPWWGPVGWSPWWRPPFHAGFRPPMGWYRPVYRPPYVPVYRPGGGSNWNRPGYGGNYNRPGGGGYYGGYQPSNRPRPQPRPGNTNNNLYDRPANNDRVKPSTRPAGRPSTGGGGRPSVSLPNVDGKPSRPTTRPGATGPTTRPAPQPGYQGGAGQAKPTTRPAGQPGRPGQNNVYADKQGNVWRDTPNGWQQNQGGNNWSKPTKQPYPAGQGGGAANRPAPGGYPTTRPAPSPDLGSAAAGRDRSAYRNPGGPPMTGNTSRPAPKPAPGSYRPPAQTYKPPAQSNRAPSSSRPSTGGGARPSSSGGGRRR